MSKPTQEALFLVGPGTIPRGILQQVTTIRKTTPGLFSTIQEEFDAFHAVNPGVFAALQYLARDMKRSGRNKCGISMLYEVLRWQRYMSTSDAASDFKLNNNYQSRYARLLMETDPELRGMFNLRSLRS